MHAQTSPMLIVAKFDHGTDIMQQLSILARDNDLSAGIVISGIGMLRDFQLGFFDGETYQKHSIVEPHELVSMQGTVAMVDDEPFFHIHASVAGQDHALKGGHLFSGTVHVTCELSVLKVEDLSMYRVDNPLGLTDLVISTK